MIVFRPRLHTPPTPQGDQELERPISTFITDHIVLEREVYPRFAKCPIKLIATEFDPTFHLHAAPNHQTNQSEERDVYYEQLLDDEETKMELVYELCVHNPAVMLSLSSDIQDLLEVSCLLAATHSIWIMFPQRAGVENKGSWHSHLPLHPD